ncbi:WD repeat-containing protein 75-like [Macrosteles quadrilineatus]|uniref:WD repeat-containing protein 75-like n=1 Tax=Macrosteles quadrilineatus TaxID=74068 RepID=UPI0023E2D6A4|nr:WD repeat-containing protein 75-like [Macrosteles quadrilineatus]
MVVILNESLQIIDNPMEENIVVRNRGGGCIVANPPLFSTDGKYIYIVCGCSISAYSILTGEHTHDFVSESKEEFVYATTYMHYLLGATAKGNLTIWSKDVSVKHVKLTLPENTALVQIHAVASPWRNTDYSLVVAVKQHDKRDLQLYHYSATGQYLTNLYGRIENKPHTMSVCDEFVAIIKKQRLTVIPLQGNQEKNSMLAGGGRLWTAVACPASGGGVAAGDDTGRILYWPQALSSNARGVFHWHTLPVHTITFSPSGSYMYSGGGEGVMVRWNVEAPNVRHFLPRLPAPIVHLVVSEDNQYVAVATQDNGIQVVDAQNKVSCVIQRLTWGVTPVPGLSQVGMFPAGLVWDSRSRSMVLNGRPGHLQFFSTDDDKLLYNLDIVGQNYLSQERTKEIINTEVTRVAVSYDGNWLVTVEMQDDQHACCDTQLKFWQYKFNARQFSLNTCVQQPHERAVTAVRFQPQVASDTYQLVTAGQDGKFRLWQPSITESIHSEGLRWVCDSVGHYHCLVPECVGFSADGSVLGVTFGPSLTLWDSELCQLNTSLTRDKRTLRAVEFGSHECCHLVVTASDAEMHVWSVLSLTIVWVVRIKFSLLCADPLSSYMAVITTDNAVFVFAPSSSTPVYERREVCRPDTSVLAAMFVPRPHKLLDTAAAWCSNSQLHFIDSNQELQFLELESEPQRGPVRRPVPSAAVTPFTVLTAQQTTNTTERQQPLSHIQLGTAGDQAVRKLLTSPANTMPHIHLFCKSFLKSLAVTRKNEDAKSKEEPELEIKMEVDEDSDNEDGLVKKSADSNNGRDSQNGQDLTMISSMKKKPRRKEPRDKRKENSFSMDDLDTDWFSVIETS